MHLGRDYIVSNNEVNALKEMIFARAKERAEALNQKAQNEYTDSFTKDVMDIARLSVADSKNPFAKIIQDTDNNSSKIETKANEEDVAEEGIGFKQRRLEKQILLSEKNYAKEFTGAEIEKNMMAARSNLNTRQSFTGALDFLNQQASLDIAVKKGKKFDAIA